jgi:hypothetical protein
VSVLRICRPGHPVDPSLFVDLGPSVGRRTFTRGAVYGGTLVVGGPRGRTVDQQRAAEEVSRNAEAARAPAGASSNCEAAVRQVDHPRPRGMHPPGPSSRGVRVIAARPDRHHLIAPVCAWCRCFPCVCERVADCACGGRIVATDDPAGAVADHQRTPRHGAWRRRMGL